MRSFEIRVVLVRTIYARNIGATSRAMSNMGASRLILVSPKCEITYDAQQAAANGQDGLQNRKVYNGWDEFYASEPADSLRIALTARDGKGRLTLPLVESLREFKDNNPRMQQEGDAPIVVHLIFGPEDWGLSGDDIANCNYCCSIPTYGDNTSLNLAQATLLALFILRQEWGGKLAKLDGQQVHRRKQDKPADVFPNETMRVWLTEMGFDLSKRRINAFTVLKRMILQNAPTNKEYRILEIVLQQSIRKLRELNDLRKKSEAPKK